MPHVAPTQAAAAALLRRGLDGPVVMLNLLRFRAVADYGHASDLAPPEPISGREAYRCYETGITALLEASGGEVLFSGTGGAWFIGPEGAHWDRAVLVRQASVQRFLAFAGDPEARVLGQHRTAALADSRLLPLAPDQLANT